jgi:hypothetical protein
MGTLWDNVLQNYLGGKLYNNQGNPTTIPEIIEQYEMDPMDVARVKGIFRAYKTLEIQVDPDYQLQAKINLQIDFEKTWTNGDPVKLLLTGFYDRKYADSFVENKMSGKPDNYLDPFFIQSQIGTYFLADPNLQYCIMEVVRAPQLKQNKNTTESPDEFAERIYQDAISRPSFYFIGYDNKTRKYGKKYFRGEFDLNELKSRYIHIFREIFEARISNGFYKNDRVCSNILPGIQCDMKQCCRYNNMSEQVYQIRKKKVNR